MTEVMRFTKSKPCPVCGGTPSDTRGTSTRCWGFLSNDRQHAFCTREEFANGLPFEGESQSYRHDLLGACGCGATHGSAERRIVATYDYRDAAGTLVYQVVRFDPKGFALRRPDSADWTWKIGAVERLPYRLPELLAAAPEAPVFIPEGEKHVDRLRALGLVATTSSEGAGKWRSGLNKHLAGRHVVLLADNDDPGRRHVELVASELTDVAMSVKVVTLAGLAPKGDVIDWLAAGHTPEELLALADTTPAWDGRSETNGTRTRRSKGSPSTQLVELLGDAELFHDADQTPYVTINVEEHNETYPINSTQIRRFLARRFYEQCGKVPTGQQLQDALNTLCGIATSRKSAEHTVHVRVAQEGDVIYLDLCNADWQVVRIQATGWDVVATAPVKFRRPRSAKALPLPERGGDLNELRRFTNLAAESDFVLFVAFFLCGLRLAIQYPVLVVNGVQGSAKSTLARIAKELVDPSTSPLSTVPRDAGDLLVTAKHTQYVALDNLSWLQDWLSDALCRLSTGGGLTKRKLYSDDEPVTIDVQRPVILTGIGEIVTRGDLLDRSFTLNLPAIDDSQRRDETEFWSEFSEAHPKLLGALLDAASMGLRNLANTKLTSMPRLAAATRWVVACESALPWAPGTFLAAYTANRSSSNTTVLESSPVYAALVEAIKVPFEGTWTDLLQRLQSVTDDKVRHHKGWPTQPHHLSNALKRIEPSLKQDGWTVERPSRKVRLVPPHADLETRF